MTQSPLRLKDGGPCVEMGESLVGSYLRYIRKCDMVLYNERTSEQGEIDVIGVRGGEPQEVWMCEVATHIAGLGYGPDFDKMTGKIAQKLERASVFAAKLFPDHIVHLEFWAPNVPVGKTTEWFMQHVEDNAAKGVEVEFVINGDYTARLQQVIDLAAKDTKTPSEPAYRLLQILTHCRGTKLRIP